MSTGPIQLDRRSYWTYTRARFTLDDEPPRPAFGSFGGVSRDLRTVLENSPRGRAGVRHHRALLLLGYCFTMLAGALLGMGLGELLAQDLLAAVDPAVRSPRGTAILEFLQAIPDGDLFRAGGTLFVAAMMLNYLAFRYIFRVIDEAGRELTPEPEGENGVGERIG